VHFIRANPQTPNPVREVCGVNRVGGDLELVGDDLYRRAVYIHVQRRAAPSTQAISGSGRRDAKLIADYLQAKAGVDIQRRPGPPD
jgi:hypothetical protein